LTTEGKKFNPFLTLRQKQKAKENSTVENNSTSPFDSIKHTERGQEIWYARELFSWLKYSRWDDFEKAIKRAKKSIYNAGMQEHSWIEEYLKPIISGKGRVQEVTDYRLNRYACYVIAMNGDPRKPEIAAAQTYFAVKTRQAEIGQTQTVVQKQTIVPSYGQAILQIGEALVAIEQEQRRQKEKISLISDRVTKLEKENTITEPLPVISARCKHISRLTTQLNESGILLYSESKALCYEVISTDLDIDIDKCLEDYKNNCRRYYAWYKINKGTPPDSVMRPAEINRLGWIALVSTSQELYDTVVKTLEKQFAQA